MDAYDDDDDDDDDDARARIGGRREWDPCMWELNKCRFAPRVVTLRLNNVPRGLSPDSAAAATNTNTVHCATP